MWECYNCAFMNVDTSPICARCRARKPAYGEKVKGRSYHAQQETAKEIAAAIVREQSIPLPPSPKEVRDKWQDIAGSLQANWEELAMMEQRQHALREALKSMINIVKNPQTKGKEEQLQNIVQILVDWDKQD